MTKLPMTLGALTLTLFGAAASAQMAPGGATQSKVIYIHTGVPSAASTACKTATSALIWANDVAYSLGDLVVIKLLPYCNVPSTGPGPVNIMVQVTFVPWSGGPTQTGEPFPCDCGGSNAGWLPTGLSAFQSVTVYSKTVGPDMLSGTYTYTVTLNDSVTGRTQSTSMVVWVLATTRTGRGPLWINYVGVPTATGVTVNGYFQKDLPMFYMWGVPGFEGVLSADPSISSSDGKSLFVPGSLETGDSLFAGSIVLMTPGAVNFSTIARNRFTF